VRVLRGVTYLDTLRVRRRVRDRLLRDGLRREGLATLVCCRDRRVPSSSLVVLNWPLIGPLYFHFDFLTVLLGFVLYCIKSFSNPFLPFVMIPSPRSFYGLPVFDLSSTSLYLSSGLTLRGIISLPESEVPSLSIAFLHIFYMIKSSTPSSSPS